MSTQSKMLGFILTACSFCLAPFAKDSAAQLQVRMLAIQEAIQMTLSRSPETQLAEAQAIRAREAEREIRSFNRPQVTAGTGLAYNNGHPLNIEGSAPSLFKVGAVQTILNKKNANLIREAEQSAKAGQLSKESVRNDLSARTASAYYELFRVRKIMPLESAGLDVARKQLELMEAQLRAGKVRPVDVKLAERTLNYARQQLLVAQEQEKLAETELHELTGLSESISIQTLEPQINSSLLESDAETLYQKALGSVPEILQAAANVRAKEFHVEAEKGDYYPRLEIVSQYALFLRTNHYSDYFNRFTRHNFLLGLSVQVPIFDGFRTSAKVAQSRQQVSAERSQLERLKSDLKLNIQKGLGGLRIARGAYDLARSDAEVTRELLQINETLLASGRISIKEIEDFRMQLQQKELALIAADQVLFQRKLELLQVMGSIESAIQ